MLTLAIGICHTVLAQPGSKAAPAQRKPALLWTTLGTNGGPVANKTRSEPANLLQVNGKPWLVDCGDGAVEKLAQAGFNVSDVNIVWISHLHMDHIGGLQGFIGLRWMTNATTPVTIYGPPGTHELVNGILQSIQPSVKISAAEPMGSKPIAQMVKVIILKDNADVNVDGVRVRTVRNSHFDEPIGKPVNNGSQSLSYRFDYGQRSVLYTGDTGPSAAVQKLAAGADLMVSEVIDMDDMAKIVNGIKGISDAKRKSMMFHFGEQHLTPQRAGIIAAGAHVKTLVFTHLAMPPKILTSEIAPKLISQTHETFKGEVLVAKDLDQF